jgi:hypothetical protein
MRRWLLACCLLAGCSDSSALPDAKPVDATPDAITFPVLEAYRKAWEAPDDVSRRNLLEYSAADALALYEPTRMLLSREEVYSAITGFQAQYPGGSVLFITNVREKHDRVWVGWRVFNGSQKELATGLDLMRRASDGRLDRVHSFYGGALPATGTDTPVQQALLDAWNETDANQRTTLLETAVTDDVVVVLEDETAIANGRAALSTLIGDRLTASPGRQLTRTHGYLTMPSAFHTAWHTIASDGTTVLVSGTLMASVATDGRISELVVWNSPQP